MPRGNGNKLLKGKPCYSRKLQLIVASWRLSNQDADPGGGHGDSPWHSTDPNLIIATIWETIGFE